MIVSRTGESYEYEDVTYTVGGRVLANDNSEWQGLYGTVIEIRDGDDRETENDTPDIYCRFEEPFLEDEARELEDRFSDIYGLEMKISDIGLEMVIMAPEMLDVLEPWDSMEKEEAYVLTLEWYDNGDHDRTEVLFTDYGNARRRMHEWMEEEMEESISLNSWLKSEWYELETGRDLFHVRMKEGCGDNYFKMWIEKKYLILDPAFIRKMSDLSDRQSKRADVIAQIMQEPDEDLSDPLAKKICNDKTIPDRLEKALGRNDGYWECYWNSVNLVIDELKKKYDSQTGKEKTDGEEDE